MAQDSLNNLENIMTDEEHSLNDNDSHKMTHHKSITKHPKPTLKCVVCGDNAFGKNRNNEFILFI